MDLLIKNYKLHLGNRRFFFSFLSGLVLLAIGIIVNFYAGSYATEKASNAVTDIILSNIRVYDVDGLFIYGPIVFWFFIGIFCLLNPQKFPFVLKSVALFVIIRSFFITLTHIGVPAQQVHEETNFIAKFVSGSGGDLFFSSHTGLPFLMVLVFWKQKTIRLISLTASIVFGTAALLGHFHYSIDVFSALFITYTIFHIALKLFPEDRELFLSTSENNHL